MVSDFGAATGRDDFIESDPDIDPTANEPRVDRVVVRVDPHVVIARQSGREPPRHIRQHRRERHHRGAVLDDRFRGPHPGRAMDAAVRAGEPAGELAVEVADVLKPTARQKARLEIAVPPFDDPFGFGVVRGAQNRAHTERPPERLELAGQDLTAVTPLTDAALLVPDRVAGNRAELAEDLEHPAQHVMRGARGHHPTAKQTREPQPGRHHPQLLGLTEPQRDQRVGLPQIPLRELPRFIRRALTRIGRHEQRAQLRDPISQDRDPARPTNPFRDHRRRHRRELA